MVGRDAFLRPLVAREPLAVALFAVGASVGVIVLARNRPSAVDFFEPAVAAAFVLTGVAYLVAGAVIRRRLTGRAIGGLLLVAGALWFGQALFLSPSGWLFTVGVALSGRHLVPVAHVLLALPHGRLSRPARRLVVTIYAVGIVLSLLTPVTYAQRCPLVACPDPRPVLRSPSWVQDLLLGVDRIGTSLLAVLVAVVLLRRLLRSDGVTRRTLAPVLLAGLVLAPAYVVGQLGLLPETPARWLYLLTQPLVPLSVLAGLVSARLHRGAVADLVLELDRGATGDELRDALARCLGDPTLRLVFPVVPSPDGVRHVDATGQPAPLDRVPGRARTPVAQDGEAVAVLEHDPALLDDPGLLDAVVAASRLVLRNAQLTAQVRAQVGELQRSRERLVVAVDAERRRLERDLHDGLQQQLLAIALELGRLRRTAAEDGSPTLGASLGRAAADLEEAIDELRRFARGLHPQVLTDRGVPAALEALAQRAPLPMEIDAVLDRLPPAVESTLYLVAAEALTNAIRHGDAEHLHVRARCSDGEVVLDVSDDGRGGARAGNGTGLEGLKDRVAALGGVLTIESPAGRGTHLRITVPVPTR